MRSFALGLALIASLACCGGTSDEVPPEAAGGGVPGGATTGGAVPGGKVPGPAGAPGATKTDLYVRAFGSPSDPPVVFLHGGPGSSSYTFEMTGAEALAARGNFVITFDQRGSGRSPKGTTADYSFAKSTQDIEDVIRTLSLDRPVLLGHSFGGVLAVQFLERHPDVARGAVVVGSPVSMPESYSNIHDRCIDFYRNTLSFGKAAEVRALHERMFPNGLVAPYTFTGDDVGETMSHAFDCLLYFSSSPTFDAAATWARLLADPKSDLVTTVQNDVGIGFQANDQVGYVDLTPLYEKQRARLYAIHGTDDGLYSDAAKTHVREVLGKEHFTLLEGAGHDPFIDRPDEVMLALASDLEALRKK